MSRPILCSVSGGRTSALLAKLLKDGRGTSNILYVFANTGKEDEKTLIFLDRLDKAFGLNLVWVEALVYPEPGQGTKFSVVSFETASREGEPFESVIAKYGIPNKHYPNCNREMKLRPIHAYARTVLETDYETAIGIRADEIDRISVHAAREKIIYPLVKLGVTKADVLDFWKRQEFDLDLPEHHGNCVTCWKKSFRKLATIAIERPDAFDFMRRMEGQYGYVGPGQFDGPRKFFRGNRSVNDIFSLASQPFEKFLDPNYQAELDQAGDCSESCDIYAGQELEFDL